MEQSTKLFIALGFLFLLYTTMNGNLEKYLKIIFGPAPEKQSSGGGGILGKALDVFTKVQKTVKQGAKIYAKSQTGGMG